MNVLAFSHRRAERLIDERLDEERGEGRVDPHDAAWLADHLGSCQACRAFESRRRQLVAAMSSLKSGAAPQGFAARVLAAKGRESEPAQPEPNAVSRYAVGGAVAAAALALFVAVGSMVESADSGGVGVSGTGAMEQVELAPHFVVRAPGLGPAKARAQAVAIIEAHGGTYERSGSAIYARVPRDELVGIMRDLSKQSRYKVARVDAGELDPSVTEVIVRFELE